VYFFGYPASVPAAFLLAILEAATARLLAVLKLRTPAASPRHLQAVLNLRASVSAVLKLRAAVPSAELGSTPERPAVFK
jgi:hypothetical protein